MSSIKEMRKLAQPPTLVKTDHPLDTRVTRHFTIYLTWLFDKLGVSANGVTFLMTLLGIEGLVLSVLPIFWLNVVGIASLLLARVLDCVDGEVARWTGKSSLRGAYLDYVSHVFWNSGLYSLCPLHLYFQTYEVKYLALAFVGYGVLQSRLSIRHAYQLLKTRAGVKPTSTDSSGQPAGGPRRSLLSRAKLLARRLAFLPVDGTLMLPVISATILLTHVQVNAPIVFLAWFLTLYNLVRLPAEITANYFINLPDIPHDKTAGR